MKTKVTVHFNGAYFEHLFSIDKTSFMKIWNNHILAIGYFELDNDEGKTIIINPSNCGMVEIEEIN